MKTITSKLILDAHQKVLNDPTYGKENQLITDCLMMFPKNDDIRIVAMKIGLIDITNSTHISQHKSSISVPDLASHIVNITNIDKRIASGDLDVVNEIANNGKINLFSFASKYCCYHNCNYYGKDDYSIYDNVLKDYLPEYCSDVTKYRIEKWRRDINYKAYNDLIADILNNNQINIPNRRRVFDHYIWWTYR